MSRESDKLPKHYSYRMDHDTGYAPHVSRGRCTVCGCKKNTVERWARPESWVFGIGGNGTKQPDKLIYAMKVKETPTVAGLRRSKPSLADYIHCGVRAAAPVLVSQQFFYFGDNAIRLPRRFSAVRIEQQGCKKIAPDLAERLGAWLETRYRFGKHGKPNNPHLRSRSTKCGCGRSGTCPPDC